MSGDDIKSDSSEERRIDTSRGEANSRDEDDQS
jgi:hypothetical protein